MNPSEMVSVGALLSALVGVGWTLRNSIEKLNETIVKLVSLIVEREVNGRK